MGVRPTQLTDMPFNQISQPRLSPDERVKATIMHLDIIKTYNFVCWRKPNEQKGRPIY